MKKSYSLLHSHTEYSNIRIIDSINKVEDLIDNAYDKGLKAIVITDHDTLSGHVRALKHYEKYKEAYEVVKDNDFENLTEDELSKITSLSIDFLNRINRNDFKVVLGNEIYISKEGMKKETYEKGDKFYHFLLIAKDEVGHKQLRQLSSRAWDRMFTRGVMRTPTYISDLEEIVKENQGHLTATTACLGGYPGTQYLQKGEQESIPLTNIFLERMNDIFGKEDFFIEIQPSMQIDQINFNKFIIENYWDNYNFVFTTDAHYLNEEDKELHKHFLHSKDGDREVDEFYSAAFVMDYDKLQEFFNDFISAEKVEKMRENTIKITKKVKDYSLKKQQVVPSVPLDNVHREEYAAQNYNKFKQFISKKTYPYITNYVSSTEISNRFFLYKIFDGMVKYTGVWDKEDEKLKEYLNRLEYELEQLWEISLTINQPMSNYFLTMEKMINLIWTEGDSIVGVSRGSAAGFLINYLIGITQIDPLRQELAMPAWRLA